VLKQLIYFVNSLLISLPRSKSLSLNWNYGSVLGIVLIFQILTGTLLAIYYSADSLVAFRRVQYIIYEVNYGWIFRVFHFNGASLFFIFLYLHFFKALFFSRYRLKFVWITGLTIFLFVMIEAFIGYVLVWAQISFWASVVITSLLSVIPIYGPILVVWVWSGFTVSGATLKFFFVLHFLVPYFVLLVMLLHLVFLHDTGRTSKLFCHGDYDKIRFYPYYWLKDSYNLLFWFLFFVLSLIYPFNLGDPEMFIEADPIISPVHIVPEWYFLFAYAILRAIPNKILGVIALLISIVSFYFFVFVTRYHSVLKLLNKYLVFLFIFTSIILSWLGQCLVETPFVVLSAVFSILYFLFLYLILFLYWFQTLLFK
jgi:ubiquinol-cytochrome c reductase cytochrome b subunit